MYGSFNPALYGQVSNGAVAAAAADTGQQVYTSAVGNPVFLAHSMELPEVLLVRLNSAYTVSTSSLHHFPGLRGFWGSWPKQLSWGSKGQHYFAQGQQILAEQQQASSKSGDEGPKSAKEEDLHRCCQTPLWNHLCTRGPSAEPCAYTFGSRGSRCTGGGCYSQVSWLQ